MSVTSRVTAIMSGRGRAGRALAGLGGGLAMCGLLAAGVGASPASASRTSASGASVGGASVGGGSVGGGSAGVVLYRRIGAVGEEELDYGAAVPGCGAMQGGRAGFGVAGVDGGAVFDQGLGGGALAG